MKIRKTISTIGMLILAVVAVAVTTATSHAEPAQPVTLAQAIEVAADPDQAFAQLTPEQQTAVIEYLTVASVETETKVESSGDLLMSSGGCGTHTKTKIGKNAIGATLYRFRSRTAWCWDGTYITDDPTFNVYGSVHSALWEYVGVTHTSESGGEGYTYHTDFAQGHFRMCLPGIGCLQHRYPAISKAQYGDGDTS